MSKFEEDRKGDYSEEGSFTHDGVEYDIKKAFNIAKDKNKRSFKVKDLEWVLKHDTPDKTRKDKADLSAPIMVAKDKKGRLTTVDGLHRLAKAVELKKSSIEGVFLSDKDLEECKISLDEKKRKKRRKRKKAGSESSKESSLRDWFKRKGAKGKEGGWVDCNAPDGKGGYKSCGRSSDEKRKKYPACRPTPSACKERGKGKSWGKKGSKKRNEEMELTSEQLKKMIHEELEAILSEKKKKKKKKKSKKDACYHKVRSRYDVWPSAYASGALVKCRKVGAKNWGNKSKKNEEIINEEDLSDKDREELERIRDKLYGASKAHKGQADDLDKILKEDPLEEAEYKGRKVPLNKPMRGDVKKFKVYVKDPKTGNIKKVNFGHGGTSAKRKGEKTMKIRKNNPKARKSFRARHNCDNPGPKTKPRYWSCKKW